MKMQVLTAVLQSFCHDGDSQESVRVKVLDTFYKIKSVKKAKLNDKTYYVVETA